MSSATEQASAKREQLQRILDCGVIAVIRGDSPEQARHLARACAAGGIVGVEITLTTPDAISAIRDCALELGEAVLMGAGTVLDARSASDAMTAGARFIVSPLYDPQTVMVTLRAHAIAIPGAFTPTEIMAATRAGADVVKLFPSTSVGPAFVRDLRRPLPALRLMPTGGVTTENLPGWLAAGVVAIGAGSDLLQPEAIARRDWSAVTARARQYVELIRDTRQRLAAEG
jgi:2-dehydro-3-deoxyphosphogluconate aldolase/(4S)-4-hydroxy-2-oxoglutarate aldolase